MHSQHTSTEVSKPAPTRLFSRLSIISKTAPKPDRTQKTARALFANRLRKVLRRRNAMTPSSTQASKVEESVLSVAATVEVRVDDAYEPTICGPSIIDKLPYDVLLAILLHMGLREIQALNRVCHRLHDATQSPEVWHGLAFDFQVRSRDLVVADSVNPATLLPPELKRAVCLSYDLEWNWCKMSRGLNPVGRRRESFELENTVVTDLLPIASTYICDDYLIMPTDSRLICFDTKKRRWLGECSMRYTRPRLSFTKSYDKNSIHAIVIGQSSDRKEMELIVLDIGLKPEVPSIDVEYNIIHKISNEWSLVAMAMNADLKTICLLVYQTRSPKDLRILVILDWEERLYCTLETGLGISRPGDHMTSLIRYSDDNNYIVVCVERDRHWIQESFNVSQIQSHKGYSDTYSSLAHPLCTQSPSPSSDSLDVDLPVYTHSSTPFTIPADTLGRADQFICWSIPQPHYKYPGVPSQQSHIFVYSVRTDDTEGGNAPQYQVAQHYTSEEGPYQDGRFVLPLSNPVIMPYDTQLRFPLMGVGFNHIAWIEMVSGDDETPYPELRFLTFPDARHPNTEPDVKSLRDVPEDVLRRAHQIFIRADMAAIMITTTENQLHTFYYA